MTLESQQPVCLYCNKKIKGRIDKKFCDDNCRNNYNNRLNSDTTNHIRNINNRLRKNRRILESIVLKSETETAKASKAKLLEVGFDFKYLTHHIKTKQDKVYNFCYEYGYMPIENDWYIIVRSKDNA